MLAFAHKKVATTKKYAATYIYIYRLAGVRLQKNALTTFVRMYMQWDAYQPKGMLLHCNKADPLRQKLKSICANASCSNAGGSPISGGNVAAAASGKANAS